VEGQIKTPEEALGEAESKVASWADWASIHVIMHVLAFLMCSDDYDN